MLTPTRPGPPVGTVILLVLAVELYAGMMGSLVTIVRRIKAPPAKVWAALTQLKLMMQWWGPDAGPTLSAVADVRPGGRFSVVFRLLNGDEHNPTGIYQEVVPEKKLVFTWEWPGMPERDSLVTFRLEPFDGGTDFLRRRGVRMEAETAAVEPDFVSPHEFPAGNVGSAIEHLVLNLPPKERASVLLQDVFD